uniref:Sodium/calcium exchanger membrane region domain-containing protein n=1 Tax=Oryza rufipogon TaxID=4529 RepID=A0A0E0QZI5_ORYRU
MAKPSATSAAAAPPAARVLIGASVNVAFLLLLAFFFFISPRGGSPPEVVSSSKEVGIRGRRDGGGSGGGGVFRVESYGERCEHVGEEDGLDRRRFPRGYVDYLYLFDCVFGEERRIRSAFWSVLRALELPLWLPRRLTIPDASKERWSKPAAVTAVTMAPVLLSHLCSRATGITSPLAVLLGVLAGASLGAVAFFTTSPDAPPADHLAAWLAAGFVMSVAWAYAVATELLALLVSAAHVMGVDSAALGLTVLAWGNSLGDLVANLAVASRGGGGGGAQVAVAGCYGGPVFDVLVGLGVSMLLSSWASHPRPVAMPAEAGPFQTLGFAAAGICWAVVVMSRRGMRVDRTLGFGLLAIYLCFLCINISQALGPV